MVDKTEIRRRMRELKRAVTADEKLRRSETVMRSVEQLPEFQRARVVLLYWSMADEVQTHGPRVHGGRRAVRHR